MKNKGVVAFLLLLAVAAVWLIVRRRRRARTQALSLPSIEASGSLDPAVRGGGDDIAGLVVDIGDQSPVTPPTAIRGRRMILVSSVFALPVLFVGVLLSFASSTIGVATGLLAHGVLYPVVAAKAGWRVHPRLARALAVASTVAGLLIVLKLVRFLLFVQVRPVAGLVFYLLHVVSSVLLCFGVFRYSAAHAFVPKPPRTGSRFSAETHRTVRILGIAFAAAIGLYAVAAALADSPLGDRLQGVGAAPTGSQSDSTAGPDQGVRPAAPAADAVAPAK